MGTQAWGQPYPIKQWLYWAYTYWSYETSAWHARLWAHQLTYLITCLISGSMAACWQEQLHYHTTKSQLSAWNSKLYELNTRLSLWKDTLRWFFESLWLATHWGHHDLKVSRNYPDPTCLAPKKMWHPLGWQTKFTTHWVINGNDHPTHILHPTQGHALVLCRKDRYQFCSPVQTNHSFIPIPASLFLPLSILLLNIDILIKPAVTLGHQCSDAEPRHTMTTNDPTVII